MKQLNGWRAWILTDGNDDQVHQITEVQKTKLLNNKESFIQNLGKISIRLHRGGDIPFSWRADILQDLNNMISALIDGGMTEKAKVEYLEKFVYEFKYIVNPLCSVDGEPEYASFDFFDDVELYEACINTRKCLDYDMQRLEFTKIYVQSNKSPRGLGDGVTA